MVGPVDNALLMMIHALAGAFGTAYVFEHTGRDATKGGVYGLVIGGFTGWFGLVPLWGWAYLNTTPIRAQQLRRRWYEWWRFW